MVKRNIKINVCLLYVLMLAMIFQTGSVPAAYQLDHVSVDISRALMLFLPFVMIRFANDLKRVIPLVVLLFIGIVINWLLYPSSIMSLAYKAVLIVLFYLVIGYILKKEMKIEQIIFNLIVLIAIITLILYLLIDVFHVPFPYVYEHREGSYYYRNYFQLYYSYHDIGVFPRLSGLFWEPGMYAIYLNLALFYYVFRDVKQKRWTFVILLISILFTQSTAGYCVMVVLIAIQLASLNYSSKKNKVAIGIICVLLAFAVAFYFVYMKRLTTNTDIGSFGLRMNDMRNGINIFLSHPLFGVGFGNQDPFMAMDKYGRGSSNGLISWLYMTGICGMFFVIWPFLRNLRLAASEKRLKQIVWMGIIVLFNIFEPIYNLPLMVFLVAREYYTAFNTRKEKEIRK